MIILCIELYVVVEFATSNNMYKHKVSLSQLNAIIPSIDTPKEVMPLPDLTMQVTTTMLPRP